MSGTKYAHIIWISKQIEKKEEISLSKKILQENTCTSVYKFKNQQKKSGGNLAAIQNKQSS